MKLKIFIVKFDKVLQLQILEMDERFRNYDIGDGIKYQTGSVLIGSNVYPELRYRYSSPEMEERDTIVELYLRGSMISQDSSIFGKVFLSNDERDFVYNKIISGLKDWSQNWDGWKKLEKNNFYEF